MRFSFKDFLGLNTNCTLGDVLVFDSTYKKHTYLYHLVIFYGVN